MKRIVFAAINVVMFIFTASVVYAQGMAGHGGSGSNVPYLAIAAALTISVSHENCSAHAWQPSCETVS